MVIGLVPDLTTKYLHGLERKGYLRLSEERQGRHVRRMYRAIVAAPKTSEVAKVKVQELFSELLE